MEDLNAKVNYKIENINFLS